MPFNKGTIEAAGSTPVKDRFSSNRPDTPWASPTAEYEQRLDRDYSNDILRNSPGMSREEADRRATQSFAIDGTQWGAPKPWQETARDSWNDIDQGAITGQRHQMDIAKAREQQARGLQSEARQDEKISAYNQAMSRQDANAAGRHAVQNRNLGMASGMQAQGARGMDMQDRARQQGNLDVLRERAMGSPMDTMAAKAGAMQGERGMNMLASQAAAAGTSPAAQRAAMMGSAGMSQSIAGQTAMAAQQEQTGYQDAYTQATGQARQQDQQTRGQDFQGQQGWQAGQGMDLQAQKGWMGQQGLDQNYMGLMQSRRAQDQNLMQMDQQAQGLEQSRMQQETDFFKAQAGEQMARNNAQQGWTAMGLADKEAERNAGIDRARYLAGQEENRLNRRERESANAMSMIGGFVETGGELLGSYLKGKK